MNQNFRRSELTYGNENDQNVESGSKAILTFDVLFDVLIFVVVINYFGRCDIFNFDVLILLTFDILIAIINLFNVVIDCNFFDVLFEFWRCEIRSSDPFPNVQLKKGQF